MKGFNQNIKRGYGMIREILYVYTVYQERSFTKAAEKLFISQPALSSMVKKVENEINTAIFDRSTNPISLTREGEYYIESIEKIMGIVAEMESHFSINKDMSQNRLVFGGSAFFCAYVLAPFTEAFKEKYPNASINLVEGKNKDMIEGLEAGRIDFALEVDDMRRDSLSYLDWDEEKIILAVPARFKVNESLKAFRLTTEDIISRRYMREDILPVSLSLFKEEKFIFLREGNDSYTRGMEMCKKAGYSPKITMVVDSLMTAYHLAVEGNGMAFIRGTLPQYIEDNHKIFFYKIDDVLASRMVRLYYRKAPHLKQISKVFMDYVRISKSF